MITFLFLDRKKNTLGNWLMTWSTKSATWNLCIIIMPFWLTNEITLSLTYKIYLFIYLFYYFLLNSEIGIRMRCDWCKEEGEICGAYAWPIILLATISFFFASITALPNSECRFPNSKEIDSLFYWFLHYRK